MTGIYTRACRLAASAPLLLTLPFVAEFTQHAVEISVGMYAGTMTAEGSRLRLAVGVVKIVSLLVTALIALRWWRLGDWSWAVRPGWGVIKGIVLILLVQLAGELLFAGGAALAAWLIAPGARAARAASALGGMILWQFLQMALVPWYVALLTDDRDVPLRRSVELSRGRMLAAFGTLLAGVLPLMIVHYLLGYGAIGRPTPLVWTMMTVDAGVVALLTACIAATWFTIYRAAVRASGADELRQDLAERL